MGVLSQIRPVNLREQVVEQIRAAIIEGRLKPNDHITEAALTVELGVSRTPVREALIILEREALIVSIPNRGSFVRAFSEEDVKAVFSMRITLENFAAELVVDHLVERDFAHLESLIEKQRAAIEQGDFRQVRRVDMSFHQYIVNASGHPLLMRNWQEIVAQVAAILFLRAEAMPDYDETHAIEDHHTLLKLFRARHLEGIRLENRRINNRVMEECIAAVRTLSTRQGSERGKLASKARP